MSLATPTHDQRAVVAVDLGAESCRVSLLRWRKGLPVIDLVHRFRNDARERGGHLRWDLARIQTEVEAGIRRAAELALEGIASIAVDGWAVDYVRLASGTDPLDDPFCYRDQRTISAELALHQRISPERMRALTGLQLLRINTVYQQFSDRQMHLPEGDLWLGLPEYLLHRWGARAAAEYTLASHSQMVTLGRMEWSDEIFAAVGLSRSCAAPLVPPGTVLGQLVAPWADVPALRDTLLIAPACHDTASAVAGIPATGEDWAYISSGTWSLVGASLDSPHAADPAAQASFTNLAGVGGRFCFHRNVNGMWLLRQCMETWQARGGSWEIGELLVAAERLQAADASLEVDDPELLLGGDMPARINRQREARGRACLDESPAGAPAMAALIVHSLAARYAEILREVQTHTGRDLQRLFIVGGGSQNNLLNRLTAQATGLRVLRGATESSTLGNFAVQLATLEGARSDRTGADAQRVSEWAALLSSHGSTGEGAVRV